MILHENKNFILKDMFEVDRSYNYKIYSTSSKKGKNVITKPILMFFTELNDGDDTLRYVEDVTEEICRVHELFAPDLKVYESRGKTISLIEMRYEQRRFRGTSWVDLTSEESEALLLKIL